MNTWGSSKKSRAQSSARQGGSGRAAPKSKSSSPQRGGVRDLTPPATRRRDTAQAELRHAVSGREHDLAGIIMIGIGVVLGLAMYFDLAGPLGSGIETFVGWFFGLARFLLPIVLVAVGVAFVRKGRSSSPLRLVLGWGLVGAATLGMLHVIRDPGLVHRSRRSRRGRRLGRCAADRTDRDADRRTGSGGRDAGGARGWRRPDHADVAAHDGDAHRARGRRRRQADRSGDQAGAVRPVDAQQRA